jgi:hypothetical protein
MTKRLCFGGNEVEEESIKENKITFKDVPKGAWFTSSTDKAIARCKISHEQYIIINTNTSEVFLYCASLADCLNDIVLIDNVSIKVCYDYDGPDVPDTY